MDGGTKGLGQGRVVKEENQTAKAQKGFYGEFTRLLLVVCGKIEPISQRRLLGVFTIRSPLSRQRARLPSR